MIHCVSQIAVKIFLKLPFILKLSVDPERAFVSVRGPNFTLVSCKVYPIIRPLASRGAGGDQVTTIADEVAVAAMLIGGPDGAEKKQYNLCYNLVVEIIVPAAGMLWTTGG